MEIFSLILSILVFALVTRRMFYQKRFDFFNGAIITGALIIVFLDIDSIWTGRTYDATFFISFAVLIMWFFNLRRKPLEIDESDNVGE